MSKLGISSLFKSVLLTAALAVSFTASAFTEGTDYMVLEKPIPNADKTLIKVFSYACPFCYKYDKAVTGPVSEKVKDVVAFTPFHLETKGEYGKQASEVFAVLINKDKAAGIPYLMLTLSLRRPSLPTTRHITTKKNAGLTAKIPLPLSKPVWMPQV